MDIESTNLDSIYGALKWPRAKWEISGSRLIAQGGTLLHWGGWCFRLKEEDFFLKKNTGIGINWPFDYSHLEPYYSKAENFLHVAGKDGDQNQPKRTSIYPYTSLPYAKTDEFLLEAFTKEGITHGPLPISRKTVKKESNPLEQYLDNTLIPHARCMTTGTCKYCPWGAIYTPNQTVDFLAHNYKDRFILRRGVIVDRVIFVKEKAVSVTCRDLVQQEELVVNSNQFILCGGTIETTKLLQRSGIQHEQLGRNLQVHPMFTVTATEKRSRHGYQQELHFPTLCSRHFDSESEQKNGKLLLAKYYNSPEVRVDSMLVNGNIPSDIRVAVDSDL